MTPPSVRGAALERDTTPAAWHPGLMRRAALAVLFLVVAGCSASGAAARELVGAWTTGSTAPDGVHGTSATYRFAEDGTFEMSGYPPIKVVGSWRVSGRDGKRLRLDVTGQTMTAPGMTGSSWPDRSEWIELSTDGRSFTYRGQEMRRAAP
jgi:hypothetical protein